MQNSHYQTEKISGQSNDKERDSRLKKGLWKINGFGHVSI